MSVNWFALVVVLCEFNVGALSVRAQYQFVKGPKGANGVGKNHNVRQN